MVMARFLKKISWVLAFVLLVSLLVPVSAFAAGMLPAPEITKHPTGETVDEGGTAKFVARANDATEITWRLVSPDTTSTYTAQEAPAYFLGLTVEGIGTETLTLGNIPASLNGWAVEARFTGPSGTSYSNGAVIHVTNATMKVPVITVQPQPAGAKVGEEVSLTVTATDPNGGTLRFQWYKNTENSNQGGTAVVGATASTLLPEQEVGTVYYYVGVSSVRDTVNSDEIYSNAVAVTYEALPEVTPTPAPTATPPAVSAPAQSTPSPAISEETPQPTAAALDDEEFARKKNTFLVIALISLVLALATATAVLILVSKKSRKETEGESEPEEAEPQPVSAVSWRCIKCGALNRGGFCTECGEKKPKHAPLFLCDNCGYAIPDPKNPPRFCPECGTELKK